MRTTLSLDDDVAAQLDRVRRLRGGSLKEIVNAALRDGLTRLETPPRRARSTRSFTLPVSLGQPLLPDVDNVAEVLAAVEGDAHR
jgi:Ribbon-helix-helix protein, copG family